MAILFFEGFDDSSTGVLGYNNGANFGGTESILCILGGSRISARSAGYAVNNTNFYIEMKNRFPTLFVALEVAPAHYATNDRIIIEFLDTGFKVAWMWYAGIDIINNNNTMVASKPIAWIPTSLNWISIKYTVSTTQGLIEVKNAHGDVILSYSGNTRGFAGADDVLQSFRTGNYTCNVDNIYILDPSGPAPFNGHLTEMRAIKLLPNAPGDLTEWSPVEADTVLDAVKEPVGNDDTNYAVTSTSGQSFLLETENIPTGENNIFGIVVKSRLKRDDAGIWRVAHLVKTGGNIYESALTPITNPGPYLNVSHAFLTNPNTGNAWTIEEINNLQIGVKAYLG